MLFGANSRPLAATSRDGERMLEDKLQQQQVNGSGNASTMESLRMAAALVKRKTLRPQFHRCLFV